MCRFATCRREGVSNSTSNISNSSNITPCRTGGRWSIRESRTRELCSRDRSILSRSTSTINNIYSLCRIYSPCSNTHSNLRRFSTTNSRSTTSTPSSKSSTTSNKSTNSNSTPSPLLSRDRPPTTPPFTPPFTPPSLPPNPTPNYSNLFPTPKYSTLFPSVSTPSSTNTPLSENSYKNVRISQKSNNSNTIWSSSNKGIYTII